MILLIIIQDGLIGEKAEPDLFEEWVKLYRMLLSYMDTLCPNYPGTIVVRLFEEEASSKTNRSIVHSVLERQSKDFAVAGS